MKRSLVALLALGLLSACSSERRSPIAVSEVSSQIVAQLTERFGDQAFKVDAISYDGAKDAFAVTLSYGSDGARQEYGLTLFKYVDQKRPSAKYSGQVPLELFGQESPHGRTFCQVIIEDTVE